MDEAAVLAPEGHPLGWPRLAAGHRASLPTAPRLKCPHPPWEPETSSTPCWRHESWGGARVWSLVQSGLRGPSCSAPDPRSLLRLRTKQHANGINGPHVFVTRVSTLPEGSARAPFLCTLLWNRCGPGGSGDGCRCVCVCENRQPASIKQVDGWRLVPGSAELPGPGARTGPSSRAQSGRLPLIQQGKLLSVTDAEQERS